MGWWDSMMGGVKYSEGPADPTLEDWMSQMFNQRFGLGKVGKRAKKTLGAIDRGDDVSSMGYFNTLRQKEAADLSSVDMDYMTGANALIAGVGGEQANLQNRMRDVAKEKVRQNSGMGMVQALADLRGQTADQYQRALEAKRGSQLTSQLGAMGNRLGYHRSRYTPYEDEGWLGKGLKAAGAVGSWFCWVAEALYGENDSRVSLLRYWLANVWARQSVIGFLFLFLYRRYGERAAGVVKRNKVARKIALTIFNYLVRRAGVELGGIYVSSRP